MHSFTQHTMSNRGEVSVLITRYSILHFRHNMEVVIDFNGTPISKLTVVALKDLLAQRGVNRTSRLTKKELLNLLTVLVLKEELCQV